MELTASIQKYAWGKKGNSSLVAQLAKSATNFEPNSQENYAELWIGTHPSGPSTVVTTGQALSDLIKENPAVLGKKVLDRFGPNLPFLLKVLSVETALSIQAHPDLEGGKHLHTTQPLNYKDANHKPEMAIALTEFEVLCGFRSIENIVNYLKNVPELRTVVGEEAANQLEINSDKESLKRVFTNLMKSDVQLVESQLKSLLAHLGSSLDESDLIGRLAQQYPGDVGIFCVFFLQHLKLQPGDAVFLPANEPHAYIYGDCVECMASSDNVVRAGLTPKYKDVETLTEMLTYVAGKDWIFRGTQTNLPDASQSSAVLYDPPVPEFSVIKYQIREKFQLNPNKDYCSVILCTEGSGKLSTTLLGSNCVINIKPGSSIFLPCQQDVGSTAVEILPSSDVLTLYYVFP